MAANPIKTKVIGIDVGVSQTTLAIVDIRGNILAKDTLSTRDFQEPNGFVTALAEKIVILSESNGGYETIRSVGMSVPSGNYVTGCIENAANLPWKGNIPLATMLRDRLGLAVALGNDAHTTALGEKAFGSAHGMKDFIIISISHGGLGSCIFTGNHAHLGVSGSAGEIGHICIVEGGRQCGCGRRGCLEQYASAQGMAKTAQELLQADEQTASVLRTSTDFGVDAMVAACESGDPIAIESLRRTGDYLGLGLANYASVLDPEGIVLTGEMTRADKWLLEPMLQSFNEHIFHNLRDKVKISVSILDNSERDVLGASVLAWEVKEYSLFK